MLETVIPKEANSLVMVVNGKHRGKIATMLEKSPSENKALLDLGSGNIKRFHYDDICACSLSNS
jgi:ribosomal protein S4E